jgi:hypothetical protein
VRKLACALTCGSLLPRSPKGAEGRGRMTLGKRENHDGCGRAEFRDSLWTPRAHFHWCGEPEDLV